ncbi:hypothetical protein AOLI_G00143140 [Acnodon oligacanthus]
MAVQALDDHVELFLDGADTQTEGMRRRSISSAAKTREVEGGAQVLGEELEMAGILCSSSTGQRPAGRTSGCGGVTGEPAFSSSHGPHTSTSCSIHHRQEPSGVSSSEMLQTLP